MISPEEKRLLSLLQQDHQSALKELFELHHGPLCRISYRIVQDADEAKDVVQEVFFKLWRNRKGLVIEISLFAYLKRAVVNTSLNALEKHKRFNRAEMNPSDEAKFSFQDTDQQQLANELALLAEKAVENLPPRTKAVFRLIRMEEMSYKEVAESLHISIKAVEKEMMKALRLLRVALKDYLPSLLLTTLAEGIHIISNLF